MFAQKNFAVDADNKFLNESYYTAIELYKKAEIKEQQLLDVIEAREENQEETCPKCKGELANVGFHNCWPYEIWVCIKCNQEYTVELVRDWTTIAEED